MVRRQQKRVMFPRLLHRMLNDAISDGFDDVLSWNPSGTSFKVHDRDRFIDDILPRYLAASKYKSFVRQLNLWGFNCMHGGRKALEKGSYRHDNFVRGHPQLCQEMKRVNVKRAQSKSERQQPDPPMPAAPDTENVSKGDQQPPVESSLPASIPSNLALDEEAFRSADLQEDHEPLMTAGVEEVNVSDEDLFEVLNSAHIFDEEMDERMTCFEKLDLTFLEDYYPELASTMQLL